MHIRRYSCTSFRFSLICNHSIVDYKIDPIVVCFLACLPAYSLRAQRRRRGHSKRRCTAGGATAPAAMSAVAMTVEPRASLARFHPGARFHPAPDAVPPRGESIALRYPFPSPSPFPLSPSLSLSPSLFPLPLCPPSPPLLPPPPLYCACSHAHLHLARQD